MIEAVITERCNLACRYCYMKNVVSDMHLGTFNRILEKMDSVLSIYNEQSYNLDFFGGEPLLNWNLIEQAVPLLKKDSKCGRFGIISNMLELDDDKIRFIKENNINTSFSFDGLWNEYNRPLKDGSSSLSKYEKMKDTIKEVAPHGCKVMVSPSSLGTLVENARYLVEDWGFNFPDFSLVRDDIWTEDDIVEFKNEIRDLSNLQIDYIEQGRDVLIGFYRLYLLDMLAGQKYGKRPFGCFAGNHGMGILPNGVGYPCARFGTNREYPLYDFNNGTLYHKNFNIFTMNKNKNPQEYEKCRNCYLYTYCNAGCTYSQMKAETRFEPVDSICSLYKILYDECFYVFDSLSTNERFINLLYPKQWRNV